MSHCNSKMWLRILLTLIGLCSLANLGECLTNPCKKGLKATQFLPHPETEEKYIQCSMFGQMFVFSCPPGLVWKSSSMACDRKSFTSMFATQSPPNANPKPEMSLPAVDGNVHENSIPVVVNELPPMPSNPVPVRVLPVPVQQQMRPVESQARVNFQRTSEPETPFEMSTTTHFMPIVQTPAPITFTTTTPVPFVPVVNNQPVPTETTQMEVGGNQEALPVSPVNVAHTGHCDTVSLSGSVFNIVNGIYSRLPSSPDIYRRSDNFQLPGLLVKTSGQQWCVTFSFSTVDFSSLTVPQVLQRCGSGMECCMLISEGVSGEIDDPSAAWIVNIFDNKGKQDAEIKITCENEVKACTKVPFCPPECLGTRDGCDVCECNGVPFFKVQSNEISPIAQLQQQQSTSTVLGVAQQEPSVAVPTPVPSNSFQQISTSTQQQAPTTQQPITSTIQQVQQPRPVQQQAPQVQPNGPIPVQPTRPTQPIQPVPVQPPQPQIIQEQQFRPSSVDHSNQQQTGSMTTPHQVLQSQELQTLKEFGQSVHQAQMRPTNSQPEQGLVAEFSNKVQEIEKQQLQNQVDQLNKLIAAASTKTPANPAQQPVTRPTFSGQTPNAQPQNAPMIVQTFPQVPPSAPVNTPVSQPQQQPVMRPVSRLSEVEERQRQELLAQQQRQQQVIAKQHQEQLLAQEQQQMNLQKQLQQIQPQFQRAPGVKMLSRKMFASRLPQPISQMAHFKLLSNRNNLTNQLQLVELSKELNRQNEAIKIDGQIANKMDLFLKAKQHLSNPIPVTKCNFVECGSNFVCREVQNCPSCSPMCFPADNFEFKNGVMITCENVRCPSPLHCTTVENSLRCVP